MPDTRSDIPTSTQSLTDAIRRRFGNEAQVDNVVQATLGGSNRTLLFDLVTGVSRRRLVSREETFTGEANPFLSPARQFRIMAHVHGAGIPVPEPIFEYDEGDALGPGFVTAFVAGETLPRRLIDRDDRAALLHQLARALARLHALPVPADDGHMLAFLTAIPESGDPVAAMRMRIDSLDEPHPALELGLRWLERHRPPGRPRAIVHGDFRNGNFMIGDNGLAALLDWECTHLGSGVEDLGWLCTRSWRFGRDTLHAGGFGTRRDLIHAYAEAGGPLLDEDEIRWWERYGLVRWAMYNILQAHGFERGRRSPAYAVCGRNTAMMEYDLLMTMAGKYD